MLTLIHVFDINYLCTFGKIYADAIKERSFDNIPWSNTMAAAANNQFDGITSPVVVSALEVGRTV